MLEALRETQTVKDGRVNLQLPKLLWGQKVEIVVFFSPPKKISRKKRKSMRGCLSHSANPALIDQEAEAWRNVVIEVKVCSNLNHSLARIEKSLQLAGK